MAEFRGKQGHWVTTESGSHLFIESGGSFEEAVEQAFGKENAKKYKKYEEKSERELEDVPDSDQYKVGDTIRRNGHKGIIKKIQRDEEGQLLFTVDSEGKKEYWSDFQLDVEYNYNDDFDNDNDFESWNLSVEDEEDKKFREFSNKINELNISDEKKKYFQNELEKAANNVSETYQTIEQVYDDAENEAFDSDEEFEDEEFDNSQRADFIVENYGDLELTDNEFDRVEDILGDEKRAEKFKNIVKDNLDLGDGEEKAVRNALENFKENPKSESIDFDNDPFFQELYGKNDKLFNEAYEVDEIGPDKTERKIINKENKQNQNKEKKINETTKKVESLLSEGKGKEFLEVLNDLSEEEAFEVLKRIRGKK